jgi:hypothetical protein
MTLSEYYGRLGFNSRTHLIFFKMGSKLSGVESVLATYQKQPDQGF